MAKNPSKRSYSSSSESSKKRKSVFTKESFMIEIAKEKLFTEGDTFYDEARTDVKGLRLTWSRSL